MKISKTFRGGFTDHFDRADAGRRRAAAARLGRRRRHAGEAQVPLRHHPPRGVQRRHRRQADAAALEVRRPAGVEEDAVDPRRRLQLRAGRATPTTAAPTRDASAYYSAIDAGFRNDLRASARRAASPRTCARRREPARDLDRPHALVRPKIKALKSGHRRHQAGRRPLPVRPRGDHRHAAPEVRIVAGRWGGRRLTTPQGPRHAADLGPRARGAVLDPGRSRAGRAGARPVRRLGRARARGALARRRARRTFVDSAARLGRGGAGQPRGARRRGRGAPRGRPAVPRRAHRGRLANTISSSSTRHTAWRSASGASCRRRCQRCWRPAALVVSESDRRAPLALDLPAHRRTPLRRHPHPHP